MKTVMGCFHSEAVGAQLRAPLKIQLFLAWPLVFRASKWRSEIPKERVRRFKFSLHFCFKVGRHPLISRAIFRSPFTDLQSFPPPMLDDSLLFLDISTTIAWAAITTRQTFHTQHDHLTKGANADFLSSEAGQLSVTWQNVRDSKLFEREFVLTCRFSDLSQSPPLFRGCDEAVHQGRIKMAEKASQKRDSGSGEDPTIAFKVPLLIPNFLPWGLLKVYHVSISPPHVPSLHHMDFWEHSFRLKPNQKLVKQNASVGQTQAQNSKVTTKPWSFLSFFT